MNEFHHTNGDKGFEYRNLKNQYHRLDGPALEFIAGKYKGFKSYCIDGILHRKDRPAKMWASGYKEYWYEGKCYPNIKSDDQWRKFLKCKILW